jgi:hypothetical protein
VISRTVIALVLVAASQTAVAGTLRDHRGSSDPNYVKPMHLPQIGRGHGGFSAIEAANNGKGGGPIVRDHRH